jgi:hypothetical protein
MLLNSILPGSRFGWQLNRRHAGESRRTFGPWSKTVSCDKDDLRTVDTPLGAFEQGKTVSNIRRIEEIRWRDVHGFLLALTLHDCEGVSRKCVRAAAVPPKGVFDWLVNYTT